MTNKSTKVNSRNSSRVQAPSETSTAVTPNGPSHEEIASHAYGLFEASGYEHGHAEDHWLRAEAELRALSPSTPRS